MENRNYTLLTDLYQLTMMNGYFVKGMGNKKATFELFFRRTPFSGGYCVSAGLEHVLEYLETLRFSDDDLEYLNQLKLFSPDFLKSLKNFSFSGSIQALPEGTLVFPNEPIMTVTGTLFEVQFLETFCLNVINFQTLIATKAARIWDTSGKGPVVEFGLRRAHGPNGALAATRASYIGGCDGTSNVLAAKQFGIPVKGTMAHSWIMSYPDELTAFRAYADVYPDTSIFLVDTYDTLMEGIPNAITVAKEMAEEGHKLIGIRLDSGDLSYLSIEARKLLDDAGLPGVKIVASNDLDEWIIESLKHQGSKIDVWGVGTKLVTAGKDSALGGVYKLVAIEGDDGKMIPKIKISQNVEKTTIPGKKKLFRIFDKTGQMIGDIMGLEDEELSKEGPITIHHPQVEYKVSKIDSFQKITPLLEEVFRNGKRIAPKADLKLIQQRARDQIESLHHSHRRLANPHTYKVGLTTKLYQLRQTLIQQALEKSG